MVLCGAAKSQLQIQIRNYPQTVSDHTVGNWTNLDSQNFTIVENFSFPSGFNADWFTTTYANIPPEGITGLLYYPQPSNGCAPLNTSTLCNPESLNLSRIALVNDYHLCAQQKIFSIQDANFDAMITASLGDRSRGVGEKVFDRSTGKTVDIAGSGVSVAVVSQAFASLLLNNAITRDCHNNITVVVRITIGPVNVESVRLGLTFFMVFSAMLVLFAPVFVCYAILSGKRYRRRIGSYDVHHMQELNAVEALRINRTQGTPYAPEKEVYHSNNTESSELQQCPICLENFVDDEMVSTLHCDGKHTFHSACIDKWLLSQITCPVCRSLMAPPIQ